MANAVFRGDAVAVAQINTITPASVTVGNIFTVTMNSKTVDYTATDTTVADVTAGIVALLNASTIPEFAEVTWADETTHVTGTANTAGKPFVNTSSSATGTGSAGHSFVTLDDGTGASVLSNGPNHWSAANFSTGVLPTASDDVFIGDTDVDILYDIEDSAGTIIVSLTISSGYTGSIGLPKADVSGISYEEYRPRNLQINTTGNIIIGRGSGSGSPRIQLDLITSDATVTVYKTGSSSETEFRSLYLVGAGTTGHTLKVFGGQVDIAMREEDTADFTNITVTENGEVRCGPGVTLDTVTANGNSELVTRQAVTTMNCNDSATIVHYEGVITTANINGGILIYNATEAITTLVLGPSTRFDASNNANNFIVTNQATISEELQSTIPLEL